MKAVKIYQAGGPEQLIYQDVPTPDIKESWSLVKIKGFGINHSEIFTREGKSPSVQFPRILGIECVGEVAQSSTPALAVGQKVVSIMGEMYGRNVWAKWGAPLTAVTPNMCCCPTSKFPPFIPTWIGQPLPQFPKPTTPRLAHYNSFVSRRKIVCWCVVPAVAWA